MGVELSNFHRSLQTVVNTYIECGFALAGLIEPTATSAII